MKLIFYFFFTLLSVGVFAQTNKVLIFNAPNISEIPKETLKGFNVDYDKFQKTNFIKAKSGWTDDFYPYISLSDDGTMSLRMVISYRGSRWIFFDKIHLIIDGEDYSYFFTDTNRDVISGSLVKEWVDIRVDEEMFGILQAVSSSKTKIDIRFSGEKSSDGKIGLKEAEITTRILELFEKLKI